MIWVGEPLKRFTYTAWTQVASQRLIVPPDRCSSNSMQRAERVTRLLQMPRGIISRGPKSCRSWRARADAVCFSTLGQRSGISRQTVQRFLRATPAKCLRVLDINLRPPFWNEAIVLQSLQLANVLKLNDAELSVLADVLGWRGADHELLQQLVDRFSLQVVALTRGSAGALLLSESGESSDLPGQPTVVADTVGAGDSFAAALVVGLLSGLPLATINAWGNRVAAFVSSHPGATPHFPDHLQRP